jgi:hypothetical protein
MAASSQAAQGRSFGKSFLSVLGAAGIIISAFTTWLDGRNAWDMPISSLYHQTFQNAPTFGLAIGAILVLLEMLGVGRRHTSHPA